MRRVAAAILLAALGPALSGCLDAQDNCYDVSWEEAGDQVAVARFLVPDNVTLQGRGTWRTWNPSEYRFDYANGTVEFLQNPPPTPWRLLTEVTHPTGAAQLYGTPCGYATLLQPYPLERTVIHAQPNDVFGVDVMGFGRCDANVTHPDGNHRFESQWLGAHLGSGQNVTWTFLPTTGQSGCAGTYRFEPAGIWRYAS